MSETEQAINAALELLADGKARIERIHIPRKQQQQWMLIVFPDRDFVFGYLDSDEGVPIGRGYMLCAERRVDSAELDAERVFAALARDAAPILAELPRLGAGLLCERDLHSKPPAQEAEEPADTSSPAPRD